MSLLQVAIAFIESHVADYLNGGEAVSRENFPKGRIYSLLDCDGKPFMVHLSGHNQAWEGLLKAGELDDLIGDPRFATHKQRSDRHDEIVAAAARGSSVQEAREYWLPRLDANQHSQRADQHDSGSVRQPADQASGHSQTDQASEDGHEQSRRQPDQYVGHAAEVFSPAPLLGENTEEILAQLGYDGNADKELKANGVI